MAVAPWIVSDELWERIEPLLLGCSRLLTAVMMPGCLVRNRRSLSTTRLCARLSTTSRDGSRATLPA